MDKTPDVTLGVVILLFVLAALFALAVVIGRGHAAGLDRAISRADRPPGSMYEIFTT